MAPYLDKNKARIAKQASYERRKSKVLISQKEKYKRIKEQFVAEKGGKCSMCGGIFPLFCYDFHHVQEHDATMPKSHQFNFHQRKMETLRKMIQCCILVCANCHRIVHQGHYKGGLK